MYNFVNTSDGCCRSKILNPFENLGDLMYIYDFIRSLGKARTKYTDYMCQFVNISMQIISRTMHQDTTGELVFQDSIPSIDICPPAHSLDFHFVISTIGFISLFIDHTMVIGTRPFGRYLDGIIFRCFLLIWSSNYLCVDLINLYQSRSFMASSRVIVSGSHEAVIKILP